MKLFLGTSTFADQLDFLVLGMTIICGLVVMLILSLMVIFCIRYHASRQKEKRLLHSPIKSVEYFWIAGTLVIFMGFFFWSGNLYQVQVTPLKADYRIYVFAKRWMWKFQHENGFMEINELHLPKGKKIHLIMISQDVIHSLFVPSFRVKQDVLPEVYTSLFLEPLKEGTSSLFCAEYCGTDHARMAGQVTITSEKAYKDHIDLNNPEPVASQGKKLFHEFNCVQCHEKGPPFAPMLGSIEDENKLRQSILYPNNKIEKDFEGVMPSYKDQISEEELTRLIEYIKQLDRSHG